MLPAPQHMHVGAVATRMLLCGIDRSCCLLQSCCGQCSPQVLQDGHLSRKGPAGRRCSWKMAEELVAEVDLDKDGTVSYEEFRNMWVTQEAVAA